LIAAPPAPPPPDPYPVAFAPSLPVSTKVPLLNCTRPPFPPPPDPPVPPGEVKPV